jgi:hypothetical protein
LRLRINPASKGNTKGNRQTYVKGGPQENFLHRGCLIAILNRPAKESKARIAKSAIAVIIHSVVEIIAEG